MSPLKPISSFILPSSFYLSLSPYSSHKFIQKRKTKSLKYHISHLSKIGNSIRAIFFCSVEYSFFVDYYVKCFYKYFTQFEDWLPKQKHKCLSIVFRSLFFFIFNIHITTQIRFSIKRKEKKDENRFPFFKWKRLLFYFFSFLGKLRMWDGAWAHLYVHLCEELECSLPLGQTISFTFVIHNHLSLKLYFQFCSLMYCHII